MEASTPTFRDTRRSFAPSPASRALQKKAHALIPGGCHTYNKGDDQYPELAPSILVRGKGARVWDADGNVFLEYGMGSRAVTLGHGFEPVVEAAHRQMQQGTNLLRPTRVELEYAEALVDLFEAADQVKFTKDGSTTTTAAVKLARAYTGRDKVAICADHPFFSYDDWFIGTTAMDAGIPQAVKDLTVSFRYDDIESVEALFDRHPGEIACLIMEPAKYSDPTDDFLQKTQACCRRHGALFILDEMITGFRWHLQGAQAYYGVEPDLSTFGKGMANGFAVSALVGRREVMELGGLHHEGERVFLLSTTHGAESHALAAGLETLRVYRERGVIGALYEKGERLAEGVNEVVDALGLHPHFEVIGKPCNLVFATRDREGRPSQAFRTLFMQELIQRGILAPSFVVSFAHTDDDLDRTVEATEEALRVYRRALEEGVDRYLVGRPVQPVFRRYNNR